MRGVVTISLGNYIKKGGFICNKELILKIAIKQKIPESLYYDDIF